MHAPGSGFEVGVIVDHHSHLRSKLPRFYRSGNTKAPFYLIICVTRPSISHLVLVAKPLQPGARWTSVSSSCPTRGHLPRPRTKIRNNHRRSRPDRSSLMISDTSSSSSDDEPPLHGVYIVQYSISESNSDANDSPHRRCLCQRGRCR